MARPSKISPAARAAIAKGLAMGATHAEIASGATIGTRTLETWLHRANKADHSRRNGKVRETEKPYLALFDEIAEAEADAEYDALEQITNHMRLGLDLDTAGRAAGVPPLMQERLHQRAVQARNRIDDGERVDAETRAFLELLDAYEQGHARAKATALASVNRAMATDWHAATWWLERNYPEEFASPNSRRRAGVAGGNVGGRPMGASSAPDRPSTGDEPPPRIRLRQVRND